MKIQCESVGAKAPACIVEYLSLEFGFRQGEIALKVSSQQGKRLAECLSDIEEWLRDCVQSGRLAELAGATDGDGAARASGEDMPRHEVAEHGDYGLLLVSVDLETEAPLGLAVQLTQGADRVRFDIDCAWAVRGFLGEAVRQERWGVYSWE